MAKQTTRSPLGQAAFEFEPMAGVAIAGWFFVLRVMSKSTKINNVIGWCATNFGRHKLPRFSVALKTRRLKFRAANKIEAVARLAIPPRKFFGLAVEDALCGDRVPQNLPWLGIIWAAPECNQTI